MIFWQDLVVLIDIRGGRWPSCVILNRILDMYYLPIRHITIESLITSIVLLHKLMICLLPVWCKVASIYTQVHDFRQNPHIVVYVNDSG